MVLRYCLISMAKNHVSTCKNNWLPTAILLVITELICQVRRLILSAFPIEVGSEGNAYSRFFENTGGRV